MTKRLPALLSALASCAILSAQYCSPTFLNGCFSWSNQSVSIGSLNWVAGSDCSSSDFTAQSTAIVPGVATPMSVTSGNWTGCAVWVDLDQDQSFADSENLYYTYVGGSPSYTYNFNITLPSGTPAGSYRMRVIAPWGSDGFTAGGANGFGPCGDFQYGNFNDFTLVVSGSTSIATTTASPLRISPNPVEDHLTVQHDGGSALTHVAVLSLDGRRVLEVPVSATSGRMDLDLSALPTGTYLVNGTDGDRIWNTRVVKR